MPTVTVPGIRRIADALDFSGAAGAGLLVHDGTNFVVQSDIVPTADGLRVKDDKQISFGDGDDLAMIASGTGARFSLVTGGQAATIDFGFLDLVPPAGFNVPTLHFNADAALGTDVGALFGQLDVLAVGPTKAGLNLFGTTFLAGGAALIYDSATKELHYTVPADNAAAHQFSRPIAFVPVNLTLNADANNAAVGPAQWIRVTPATSDRTVTGIANGKTGKELMLTNVGANNLIVAHESGSSTAANRVVTQSGANVTVAPNGTLHLRYDATTSRWRQL